MTINTTRWASNATKLLAEAVEEMSVLYHILDTEEDLQILRTNLQRIGDAKKDLIRIMAQDNGLEIKD